MTPSPTRDFVVGLFVLVGLGAVAYLSFKVGGLSYKGPVGFHLVATFGEIGGLKVRAPVVISGVRVGQVERIELDKSLRARVSLDVDPKLKLAVDSTAAIRTAGLLGDQFVAIVPGAEEEDLKSGDQIAYTESALGLESLVGKLVTGLGSGGEEKK